MPQPAPRAARPVRADAQRNRQALMTAARRAFATQDAVTLEDVARAAGVGIGTLYRHFPTREALVEAVYAAELDAVTGSAPGLLTELTPPAALRALMDRYASFAAAKRGMVDTLRAAGWASGRIATPATRERLTATIATILVAGARDGSLRPDVEADDVTTLLLGVFLATTQSATEKRTGALLDLLVDALRPAAQQ